MIWGGLYWVTETLIPNVVVKNFDCLVKGSRTIVKVNKDHRNYKLSLFLSEDTFYIMRTLTKTPFLLSYFSKFINWIRRVNQWPSCICYPRERYVIYVKGRYIYHIHSIGVTFYNVFKINRNMNRTVKLLKVF